MARATAGAAPDDRRVTALTRAGGFAALVVAAVLMVGLAGLLVPLPGLGLRNWLVVLFGIDSGLGGLPADPLRVFNPWDIGTLALAGVAYLGLWPVLGGVNRIWMGIAVVLPFAGIAVLAATGLAGRSGLMGGGLVVAALMIRNRSFGPVAYVGMAANVLLLIGDFATAGTRAPLVAVSVGVGYVLLVAWFLVMGTRPATRGIGAEVRDRTPATTRGDV
jgi:hypothetical protein